MDNSEGVPRAIRGEGLPPSPQHHHQREEQEEMQTSPSSLSGLSSERSSPLGLPLSSTPDTTTSDTNNDPWSGSRSYISNSSNSRYSRRPVVRGGAGRSSMYTNRYQQRSATPYSKERNTSHTQQGSGGEFRRTPGAPTSRGPGLRSCRFNNSDDCTTTPPPYMSLNNAFICRDGSGCHSMPSRSGGFSSGRPSHVFSRGETHVPYCVKISNLDYNISMKEWSQILYSNITNRDIHVREIRMTQMPDNTSVAHVFVNTEEDLRVVIRDMHRTKIGYKRIHVEEQKQPTSGVVTRSEIIGILKDVPNYTLPLFKFGDMCEKRYGHRFTLSDLYHMSDIVQIGQDASNGSPSGGGGRHIKLVITEEVQSGMNDHNYNPVCLVHCAENSAAHAEVLEASGLPNVQMDLKTLARNLITVLNSHGGDMPLMSFVCCYEGIIDKKLSIVDGGKGVPLEHLISCVDGVQITTISSATGIKQIQYNTRNETQANERRYQSQSSLTSNKQLSQFTREVIELLKNTTYGRMLFTKFIPEYHHYFGRQCRVADYGYSKLDNLLKAISHVLQITGSDNKKFLMLTHRCQVKRFTTDLLKVLKSQASKQVSILEFPIIYKKVIGRQFEIVNYGVCYLDDLLAEINPSTLTVTGDRQEMVLSIPRREQTSEEVGRTQQFAVEVVDLLRHEKECKMPFNKFIPNYHHHFGKQCRVADYGFQKLIELFEAIPHVLEIQEEDEDKMLCLTQQELLKVLERQVSLVLERTHRVQEKTFLDEYVSHHGANVYLDTYGVETVAELIAKIPRIAKMVTIDGVSYVELLDKRNAKLLCVNILKVFIKEPGKKTGKMELDILKQKLFDQHKCILDWPEMKNDLENTVEVTKNDEDSWVASLCPLPMFARDVYTLLVHYHGEVVLNNFEAIYNHFFHVELVPNSYGGFASTRDLLQAIPYMVAFKGKGRNQAVYIHNNFVPLYLSTCKPGVATIRGDGGGDFKMWNDCAIADGMNSRSGSRSSTPGIYESSNTRTGRGGRRNSPPYNRDCPPEVAMKHSQNQLLRAMDLVHLDSRGSGRRTRAPQHLVMPERLPENVFLGGNKTPRAELAHAASLLPYVNMASVPTVSFNPMMQQHSQQPTLAMPQQQRTVRPPPGYTALTLPPDTPPQATTKVLRHQQGMSPEQQVEMLENRERDVAVGHPHDSVQATNASSMPSWAGKSSSYEKVRVSRAYNPTKSLYDSTGNSLDSLSRGTSPFQPELPFNKNIWDAGGLGAHPVAGCDVSDFLDDFHDTRSDATLIADENDMASIDGPGTSSSHQMGGQFTKPGSPANN